MTSDERKTLEALADDARHLLTTTTEERAAIRAALATVDALTQQVATVVAVAEDPLEHGMEHPGAETLGGRVSAAIRAACADAEERASAAQRHLAACRRLEAQLKATIADLEARAIPPEWVAGSEGWHILVDGPDGAVTVHHAEYDPDPATRWQCWTPTQRSGHPTLAAALRAATEAT